MPLELQWCLHTVARLVASPRAAAIFVADNADRETVTPAASAGKSVVVIPVFNRQQFERGQSGSWLETMQGAASDSCRRVLLCGEWWDGSGRTCPVPATLPNCRWYQPEKLLDLLERDAHIGLTEDRQARASHETLIVSGSAAEQTSVSIAVRATGRTPIAVGPFDLLPRIDCQSVLVFENSFENCSSLEKLPSGRPVGAGPRADDGGTIEAGIIRRLRQAYPRSVIVCLFAFPRWDVCGRVLAAGANLVSGRPADYRSLLAASDRFSSAALPRR